MTEVVKVTQADFDVHCTEGGRVVVRERTAMGWSIICEIVAGQTSLMIEQGERIAAALQTSLAHAGPPKNVDLMAKLRALKRVVRRSGRYASLDTAHNDAIDEAADLLERFLVAGASSGERNALVQRLQVLRGELQKRDGNSYDVIGDAIDALSTSPAVPRANEPELASIAHDLVDQSGEPWPEGTESDRLHYWRDKAIRASRRIAALSATTSGKGEGSE